MAGPRGKKLGGAPRRTGKWVRTEADKKANSQRGTLIAVLVISLLVLGSTGVWLWQMGQQLDAGLLHQRQEARRRADWVPLRNLPAYVPAAFRAVVDTTSFANQQTQTFTDDPRLSRDLIRQVHRLTPAVRDEMRELAMTPLLERDLSANERLELYMNRIDLGRTGSWPVYGIYHASEEYFGKPASRLSVGESATLAGLLLPPRIRVPEHMAGPVGARRNEVLRKMREAGTLNEAQYRAAVAEPLGFQPGIEYAPMTRPLGWREELEVIRLPVEANPAADSAKQAQGTE